MSKPTSKRVLEETLYSIRQDAERLAEELEAVRKERAEIEQVVACLQAKLMHLQDLVSRQTQTVERLRTLLSLRDGVPLTDYQAATLALYGTTGIL